jgi:hypothetical protein
MARRLFGNARTQRIADAMRVLEIVGFAFQV